MMEVLIRERDTGVTMGSLGWAEFLSGLSDVLPDTELLIDELTVRETLAQSKPLSESAWDMKALRAKAEKEGLSAEKERREEHERLLAGGEPTRAGSPYIPGIGLVVEVLLPAVAGAVVQAVARAVVDWLRKLHQSNEERTVLIYGPNGEPLRKIRRRALVREPEVFARDWPPPRPDPDDRAPPAPLTRMDAKAFLKLKLKQCRDVVEANRRMELAGEIFADPSRIAAMERECDEIEHALGRL